MSKPHDESNTRRLQFDNPFRGIKQEVKQEDDGEADDDILQDTHQMVMAPPNETNHNSTTAPPATANSVAGAGGDGVSVGQATCPVVGTQLDRNPPLPAVAPHTNSQGVASPSTELPSAEGEGRAQKRAREEVIPTYAASGYSVQQTIVAAPAYPPFPTSDPNLQQAVSAYIQQLLAAGYLAVIPQQQFQTQPVYYQPQPQQQQQPAVYNYQPQPYQQPISYLPPMQPQPQPSMLPVTQPLPFMGSGYYQAPSQQQVEPSAAYNSPTSHPNHSAWGQPEVQPQRHQQQHQHHEQDHYAYPPQHQQQQQGWESHQQGDYQLAGEELYDGPEPSSRRGQPAGAMVEAGERIPKDKLVQLMTLVKHQRYRLTHRQQNGSSLCETTKLMNLSQGLGSLIRVMPIYNEWPNGDEKNPLFFFSCTMVVPDFNAGVFVRVGSEDVTRGVATKPKKAAKLEASKRLLSNILSKWRNL